MAVMDAPEFHFRTRFLKAIEEEQGKWVKDVAIGKPKNFDEYRFHVGVLEGFKRALQIADNVERELLGKPPRS